jgi:hypothetical protein
MDSGSDQEFLYGEITSKVKSQQKFHKKFKFGFCVVTKTRNFNFNRANSNTLWNMESKIYLSTARYPILMYITHWFVEQLIDKAMTMEVMKNGLKNGL